MDVWQLIEDAPMNVWAVSDLYSWSTNYESGSGPFALFLDLIGWSDEEIGTPIYGPTVSTDWSAGPGPGQSGWSDKLGYVELDKLGAALREYALNPRDVREYVDKLMQAEAEE